MADKGQGKVEIKIGNLNFAAEGDQQWLGEQLSKVIKAAEEGAAHEPAPATGQGTKSAETKGQVGTFSDSLASYLKAKGGETKQVQRFLATAGWLYHRNSATELDTAAISKALSDNHQKRLGNPADCLNQNCGKGFCEKKGKHFFITPQGWKALGEEQ